MPELPDITVYHEALEDRIVGSVLETVSVRSLFVLRTFEPAIESTFGRQVQSVRRLGKRLAIGLEGELWLVLHLMILGRLQWKEAGKSGGGKALLANFQFETGNLLLTEFGTRKQASLHVVTGSSLAEHDPGGLEVLHCTLEEFTQSLTLTNRTLKRQLTNPWLFSGIGNAYSDEILHHARLSPIQQSQKLNALEIERLYASTREVLQTWIDRLRRESRGRFPTNVTAFRPEMAVHGKFGTPCPVCGAPVQRIVYAENETNYCAGCQTGGRVLADRSLSRLLKEDWPRRIEDWELKC